MSNERTTEGAESEAFNRQVGEKLRVARKVRGWSLQDVETISEGEFKASVLGAYERGERSLSVFRLTRLASMYEVAPISLLPAPGDADRPGVVLDLDAAEQISETQGEMVDRFLGAIQLMRRSLGKSDLAVRSSDLEVLSALINDGSLAEKLRELDTP